MSWGKEIKCGACGTLYLFSQQFCLNITRARMLDSIIHITLRLLSRLWRKKVMNLSKCTQRCYRRHNGIRKSVNSLVHALFHWHMIK